MTAHTSLWPRAKAEMLRCITVVSPPCGEKPGSKVKFPSLGTKSSQILTAKSMKSFSRSPALGTADLFHGFWKVSERSEFLYYKQYPLYSLPVVQNNYKGFNHHVKKALDKGRCLDIPDEVSIRSGSAPLG